MALKYNISKNKQTHTYTHTRTHILKRNILYINSSAPDRATQVRQQWSYQCPVKLFVGLHEVRGQPRFETRSLYHFMFKGEGGVVHGKMASAHFMCVTLLGNPYVNKQLICFRFKKNIRYSTTEYNLLSHLLFYTNVFYTFGLSHCEKLVYY